MNGVRRRSRGRDRGARPHDVTMVGHSTGGGEVARYIGRHGTDARRQGRADRRGAAAPRSRPLPIPRACRSRSFDGLRAASFNDRSQFYKDLRDPVLRREPARRQGLARRARPVLALEHAVRPEELRTSASRPCPRPTSPRTSRASTYRRCCSTARTIRSFRCANSRRSRRASSRARRTSTTRRAARHHGHAPGSGQRRPAGVPQELASHHRRGAGL